MKDMLEAVLDAIELPRSASLDGDAARGNLMATRAMYASIAARRALNVPADTGLMIEWLRDQVADHPVTYTVGGES